jgi:hypothetical protein
MKHIQQDIGHNGDALLVAIGALFERHAAEADLYYADGRPSPQEEHVEETCLDAVGTALMEAAIGIRHQAQAGRAAKERMLAHIERWAGKDSLPYSEDPGSLGGRLSRSLG